MVDFAAIVARMATMEGARTLRRPIRFAAFEVDLKAGELRKQGRKLRLQEQPFQLLRMLLERAGEVVSREELHQTLAKAEAIAPGLTTLSTPPEQRRGFCGSR